MWGELQGWWIEQISGLLPRPLLRLAACAPDAVVVDFDQESVALSLRRRGATGQLGRFARDLQGLKSLEPLVAELRARKLTFALRVAPGQMLRKAISLPVAARRNLDQALAFELSRETPFEDGEVLWDYAIMQQNHGAQRLVVELVLVPRTRIAEIIQTLRSAGAEISALEIETPGRTYRIATRNGSARTRRASWRAAHIFRLAVGALALVALALPFVRQELAGRALDDRFIVAESQTKAAIAMKKEIDRLSKAANLIADERTRIVDPLAILAAATRAIPDDGYLTALVMHDNRITLVGSSPSAATLIGSFASIRPFKDPAFAAPVVRQRGDLEFFTIEASIGANGGKP